jgi:hypothetical protein
MKRMGPMIKPMIRKVILMPSVIKLLGLELMMDWCWRLRCNEEVYELKNKKSNSGLLFILYLNILKYNKERHQ